MASKSAPKKNNSALKRTRQDILRHERNTSVLARLKTEEKKVMKALGGEIEDLVSSLSVFASMLDKAVKRGVIHKNVANRKKSVMNKRTAAGKTSVEKPKPKPKAPKGESAKEKSKAKAKVRAKAKAKK